MAAAIDHDFHRIFREIGTVFLILLHIQNPILTAVKGDDLQSALGQIRR